MKIVEKEDYLEVYTKCNTMYKVNKDFRILFESFEWYRGHYDYLTLKVNGTPQRFHKIVCKCEKGQVVDHINRDRTDNRRENLRAASQQSNNRNRKNITGKYKGVSWSKHAKKFRATIRDKGKQIHLGYYQTEEEAAIAYNEYVEANCDEFAYLNEV